MKETDSERLEKLEAQVALIKKAYTKNTVLNYILVVAGIIIIIVCLVSPLVAYGIWGSNDAELRGRVFSLFSLIVGGGLPTGGMLILASYGRWKDPAFEKLRSDVDALMDARSQPIQTSEHHLEEADPPGDEAAVAGSGVVDESGEPTKPAESAYGEELT